MNNIEKSISGVYRLDEIAQRDIWLNKLSPLAKLITTVAYIATVVSFNKYDFTGLLGMIIYLIVLFVLGDISFKESLVRLRIVLPIVCIVGIINPFMDREVILTMGSIGISGGVISMITLMMKGVFSVLSAYILIASTSIEKIGHALRQLHVPKIIVTMILLIYRYIIVFMKEVLKISQAYSLRAPGQKGINIKSWGPLVGQLILRSFDRADGVYSSMCLRGFDGEFPVSDENCGIKGVFKGIFFVLIVGVYLYVFRRYPVFEIVGGMM